MQNEFDIKNDKEDKSINAVYEARKDNYYREINFYRRHYSQLRFAVFPLYLTIQGGLMRFSFSIPDNVQSFIPLEYLLPLAGILITYVFWTIESRILSYYNHLSVVGSHIETEYGHGYNMITEWPKSPKHPKLKSRLKETSFSIGITYIFFIVYWLAAGFYRLYK